MKRSYLYKYISWKFLFEKKIGAVLQTTFPLIFHWSHIGRMLSLVGLTLAVCFLLGISFNLRILISTNNSI